MMLDRRTFLERIGGLAAAASLGSAGSLAACSPARESQANPGTSRPGIGISSTISNPTDSMNSLEVSAPSISASTSALT